MSQFIIIPTEHSYLAHSKRALPEIRDTEGHPEGLVMRRWHEACGESCLGFQNIIEVVTPAHLRGTYPIELQIKFEFETDAPIPSFSLTVHRSPQRLGGHPSRMYAPAEFITCMKKTYGWEPFMQQSATRQYADKGRGFQHQVVITN